MRRSRRSASRKHWRNIQATGAPKGARGKPIAPYPLARPTRPSILLGPDGNPQGFNIDLARMLCEELKLACTIQMRRFETLIPAAADSSAGYLAIATTEWSAIEEGARGLPSGHTWLGRQEL